MTESWKAFEGALVCIPGLHTASGSADHSADQFKVVKISGNGSIVLASSAGEVVDGVLQGNPTGYAPAEVANGGVSKCVAGAAISAGELVMANASGKAIPATAGNFFFGRAITSAAAEDEIVSVVLGPTGYVPTT